MYYAKVIGNVVATIKHQGLEGKKIQVIQPIDLETGEEQGTFLVALDATSAGIGDIVGYEDGSEATWAFDQEDVPTDATIVALIDKVNINRE
ncbi:MAG: EutN/CcmL family microcompartment protein [Actinomycetota bacterium]|nr:EutN/CcmL family microcompartment protein [Actinomycetota bacterium]